MSDLESRLWVNVLFRGRQLAEFLAVKKHLGIQSNTDVVRHLIHKQARALRRRSRPLDRPAPERSDRAGPAPRTPDGRASGNRPDPPDPESLCLSCSLPDCDEDDPRCRYRQATGPRAV